MRKLNVSSQELQALYPPVSQAFQHTVANTLHGLAQRKEQPAMKKKISAALVAAILLILLTISAAIALTQSNLLGFLFGKDNPPPASLENIVSRPEATVANQDVKVTWNEYLYDGEKLLVHWSVDNLTGRQIMITMTPFKVKDKQLMAESHTFIQVFRYELGYILGGKVGKADMPDQKDNYAIYANPQQDDKLMYHTFTKGETLEITSSITAWEVLNQPVLMDPADYDYFSDPSVKLDFNGLPSDKFGRVRLDFITIPGRNPNDVYVAEERAKLYEKNGWAKRLSTQPVTFTIELNTPAIGQVKPKQTSLKTEDYTLAITHMTYKQTGGTLALHFTPNHPNADLYTRGIPAYDFTIVYDDNGKSFHNGGGFTSINEDNGSVDYYIPLRPVSGEFPKTIRIVPGIYNPKRDPLSASYDPGMPKDPHFTDCYDSQLNAAWQVELE